jgi:drug/metabolite transporter (DMT)-like permease
MIARPTRSDWLLLVALGLMWGTSYVFIKIGVETLPTFTLIAARLAVGLALLATVVAIAREPLPRSPRLYGHLLVMSIVNIVVPFALITTAEQSVDSALAATINGAVPLVVILLAAFFLHDEPMTVGRLLGLVIGYVGVVVLVSRSLGAAVGTSSFSGELALVGSTLSYGAGAVYARHNMRGVRPMIPALFQVAFAFVIVTALAFATERPLDAGWTPNALFAILWLGIFGSGLAYLANFRLLSRIGATRTSLLAYMLPIVGIISGAVVLQEQVDDRLLFGTALIIGGIAVVNSRRGGRRLFGRTPPPASNLPADAAEV